MKKTQVKKTLKIPTPVVCELLDTSNTVDIANEANARLIAAAPELLAAVRSYQQSLFSRWVKRGDARKDENLLWVESLIAKIEGRA